MKEYLLAYIQKHNLLESARDAFNKAFTSYKIDEKEECCHITGTNDVNLILDSIAYHISYQNINEVVIIKYDILSNDKIIGNYRLVIEYQTCQLIDDYLVFE